jgi:hypothetical protein
MGEGRPEDIPKLTDYQPSRFMLETSHYDEEKADRAVRFIENLKHTKGKWAGKRFWLFPWQEQVIRDIFGIVDEHGNRQFRTAYVEIPKKNGKSELAAAVALYPIWACPKHIDNSEECSMKSIREDELESAFVTIMNKLIFARDKILPVLAREHTHKDSLQRLDEINQKLEKNAERQKTLEMIIAKGYLDPAVITREKNELLAEAEWLESERQKAMQLARGNSNTRELVDDLCTYIGHSKMGTDFDGDLVERFIDHIIVHGQEEVMFCFKCGLNLRERLG